MFRVFARNINGLIGLLTMLSAVSVGATSASAAEIVAARLGETSATQTRIVLDSKGLPEYSLDADSAGAGRLKINFAGARLAGGFADARKPVGLVSALTASQSAKDAVTAIVELKSPAKLKEAFVIPPGAGNPRHRLVIDLVAGKPSELIASLPVKKYETITEVIQSVAPQPATSATNSPALVEAPPPAPAPAPHRPVIVVDAGHGGSDPGAAGPSGSKESMLTLSAALVLAEALKETGRYEVVLTRAKDERLAHEERSRIARDAKADLFISLHADAHADAKVRGGSIYTLSDEGTERSAREALAQGNYLVFDLDIGETDPQLGGILYNLAQRKTSDESDKFAELLIGKLAGVTPLLNNTHRRGNFRVLLAPDVPAVLFELAFISNKHDEANLKSAAWRQRSMGAVVASIDAYFQQRGIAKHASNSGAAAPR